MFQEFFILIFIPFACFDKFVIMVMDDSDVSAKFHMSRLMNYNHILLCLDQNNYSARAFFDMYKKMLNEV